VLQHRIERWLEQEGVFSVAGLGDMELAGELDWEPGAGPVYLRCLADGQVWRVDITMTARPAPDGGTAKSARAIDPPDRVDPGRPRTPTRRGFKRRGACRSF
jgi:hypothetical protein